MLRKQSYQDLQLTPPKGKPNNMKIEELDSTKRITDWLSKGNNHGLDDNQMGHFIKELIPYLKHHEFEIERLQQRVEYLENQNNYLNNLTNG